MKGYNMKDKINFAIFVVALITLFYYAPVIAIALLVAFIISQWGN